MSERPARSQDPTKRSMLLTALYIAQEQHGYLSKEAIEQAAARLDLPTEEVYSTASFYTMFRTQLQGHYVIQVCEGLCCYLAGGGERLVDYVSRKLDIQAGETTSDGLFTLQTVQCLASCGTSPAVRVNDELYEDMTAEKVDRLLDQLAGR